MKKFLIVASLLFAGPVMAQQAPAPQEFNLKVTTDDINIISEALGTQSFNKVVVLVNKLRVQILEQQKPQAPAANVTEPAK